MFAEILDDKRFRFQPKFALAKTGGVTLEFSVDKGLIADISIAFKDANDKDLKTIGGALDNGLPLTTGKKKADRTCTFDPSQIANCAKVSWLTWVNDPNVHKKEFTFTVKVTQAGQVAKNFVGTVTAILDENELISSLQYDGMLIL